MWHNTFDGNIHSTSIGLPGGYDTPVSTGAIPRVALATRLRARLFAGRLDQDVEAGIVPLPASPLALHMVRLISVGEREALAHSLRQAISDVAPDGSGWSPRIPVHAQRLATCRDIVDDITLLLHSPRPVRARGMARLRMLISNGAGPLYRNGRGSLAADLRGVLAAL